MTSIEQASPERREVKEGEIILRILLQRHGPKLNATGEKNELAPYFEKSVRNAAGTMKLEDKTGLVRVSSSPIERAHNTAIITNDVAQGTEARGKHHIVKREALAVPLTPDHSDLDAIVGLQRDFKPDVVRRVTEDMADASAEEQQAAIRDLIDRQVLAILFSEEERTARNITLAPEDMAETLARRYKGFQSHTGLLEACKEKGKQQPEDEPYLQIDVSHSYPIMSFLRAYLIFDDGKAARNLDSDVFFERVGGVIRESDFLTLDYRHTGDAYQIQVNGSSADGVTFSGRLAL